MAGSGAAVRAGEHAAEGIIAKAAKDVLRDAEGPLARAAARGGERAGVNSAEHAAEREITKTLQAAVTRARAALLKDPARAASHLSERELQAVARRPWLARIHFGNSLEREVARDPDVLRVLEHRGGAGRPDFVDRFGRGYEVTTSNPATVAAHLRRSYVDPERLATYPPIPANFRFLVDSL